MVMLMFFVSFHVSMMCYAVLLCIVLRVNVVVSFRMWMLWRANRFCFVPCVNAVACMRAWVRARMLAREGKALLKQLGPFLSIGIWSGCHPSRMVYMKALFDMTVWDASQYQVCPHGRKEKQAMNYFVLLNSWLSIVFAFVPQLTQ